MIFTTLIYWYYPYCLEGFYCESSAVLPYTKLHVSQPNNVNTHKCTGPAQNLYSIPFSAQEQFSWKVFSAKNVSADAPCWCLTIYNVNKSTF